MRLIDRLSIGAVLKISLFATGCAGMVAEFVLSTLATYLVGNAVFQWTIVMSLMLFAMGVGSRISRYIHHHLLDAFIITEFSLSALCAGAAIFAYAIASYTTQISLLIYLEAFIIGNLIGLEIPLVTRINESYEELRTNISGVMEKDYYGALFGGLTFAFLALPKLGLTYTPILLGAVNFSVATLVLWRLYALTVRKKLLSTLCGSVLIFLIGIGCLAKPIVTYGEQSKYKDKIIFAVQTPYQRIVMTQWKNHYWLYINDQEQFSTYDEEKYHEPLVHLAIKLSVNPSKVLVLGGGDGLAIREILKYSMVDSITVVDIDPYMTELAKNHPILSQINQLSMHDPRVKIVNQDAVTFLDGDDHLYGVIICDLPDPDSIDLMHVYALSFYQAIHKHLVKGGIFVTQATSPYFSNKAFLCILKTIEASGFSTLPYHNYIPTMGEWGWVIGARSEDIDTNQLKKLAMKIDFSDIPTKFINRNAVISMIHFGKGIIEPDKLNQIFVNTKLNPVLYDYYLSGTWGFN